MKKLLIATIFAGFALSSQAEGWYAQGDLGFSNIATADSDVEFDGSSISQRLSVGYDYGEWRFAGDYTNFGKVKSADSYGNYYDEVSLKLNSIGVTGIRQFDIKSNFKPYAGVRISYNKAKVTEFGRYNCLSSYCSSYRYGDSYSVNRIGLGIIGGVQYKLTNQVSLNLNAEYNRVAADVYQLGVQAGIRFDF